MGYDLFPMETLAFKRRFIREAIEREYLIFFEHDPAGRGRLHPGEGRRGATSSRCYRHRVTPMDNAFRSASSAAAACTTWPT